LVLQLIAIPMILYWLVSIVDLIRRRGECLFISSHGLRWSGRLKLIYLAWEEIDRIVVSNMARSQHRARWVVEVYVKGHTCTGQSSHCLRLRDYEITMQQLIAAIEQYHVNLKTDK